MAIHMDEILAQFESGAISFREAVRRAAPLLSGGEPDTADLADEIAAINAACDAAKIAKLEGKPSKRVAVMAEMLAEARAELAQLDAKPARLDVLPPPAFIESLRSLGVVGDVTVRVTH